MIEDLFNQRRKLTGSLWRPSHDYREMENGEWRRIHPKLVKGKAAVKREKRKRHAH